MTLYGGETRSPDFKPDRFGYTIPDEADAEVPVEDDEEAQANLDTSSQEK